MVYFRIIFFISGIGEFLFYLIIAYKMDECEGYGGCYKKNKCKVFIGFIMIRIISKYGNFL